MSSAAANDIQNSGFFTQSLTERDPEIAGWIAKELGRQKDKIELIASENITSRAVLEATLPGSDWLGQWLDTGWLAQRLATHAQGGNGSTT